MRRSVVFAVLLTALLGVSCSPSTDEPTPSPSQEGSLTPVEPTPNPSQEGSRKGDATTNKAPLLGRAGGGLPEAPLLGGAGGGSPQNSKQATYHVTGKITELHPAENSVEIQHDEIPGYMKAMTMPFDVKDTNILTGLNPGDTVSFKLVVQPTDAWIENIRVTGRAATSPATNAAVIRMRDVEPVAVGDLLPEYQFTNEFGAPVSTTQFKGRALVVSFLFTRCPLPTFCPLMARNLAETQRRLTALPNGPTNWHLLAVTIDPGHDTPAVLRDYGDRFDCRTNSMSFLTGDITEIAAFGEQFGLTFAREAGTLPTHNLRTVVVDASGKIQNIIVGNKWTVDELVTDIVKAAAVKP